MELVSDAAKILVVDDDQGVLDFLRTVLRRQNYGVVLAKDGEQALELAPRHRPDLVILDLFLPGLGGLQVCSELRSWYKAPILILSGRGDDDIVVEALDSGADDYVSKPVSPRQLLARIRALLRRGMERPASLPVWVLGDVEIDRARRRISIADEEVRLTRTEFDILAYLAENLDCVVTLHKLMDKIWGPTHGDYAQTLRVHVGHIRKKIELDPSNPIYIVTEPGVGYRFPDPSGSLKPSQKWA